MKIRVAIALLSCALLAALTLPAVGAAGAPTAAQDLTALEPGELASLEEDVLVQFVFVGYSPNRVEEAGFLAGLPERYRPIVRSRASYGIEEFLGITYKFDYDVTYTEDAYEDSFFTALAGMGTPAPLVQAQKKYNKQDSNVLDIPADGNLFIDAPSVEKWLIDHPPAGVDTERNTVFFVNWWNRNDFQFHVYTKIGEPDPDTGYDFGANRASRKIIAWGGTTPDDEETGLGAARGVNRVWFYDLSAGPDSWTTNWNVDDPNLFGTQAVEYRMPPIWEYSKNGFRKKSKLTGDLSMVARYVAIDLLFTTSPLYPPALTPPGLPQSINLDINTVNGWPVAGVDPASAYDKIPLLLQELGELGGPSLSADEETIPFAGQTEECFIGWAVNEPCYPNQSPYPPSANLFLDAALNRDTLVDGSGADYEAGLVNYATDDAPTPLGFADDNYYDGTQSFVFSFVSPGILDAGYGLTTTQIHEFGHHLGLSHPHDGYDYEDDRDFGPGRDRYFAWSGDQQNSIMSYIDLNWDFSQFDRDNYQRFLTAAYLTNANAIAAEVLASPGAGAAAAELAAADASAVAAESAFTGHSYPGAVSSAESAFAHTLAAAALAGVTVESSENGWYVQPPSPTVSGGLPRYAYIDVYGRIARRALP
jgi:hypothetical protein